MQITEFLDKSGVKYEIKKHKPVFTAQQIAAEEHEPGRFVAKPVIVRVDNKYIMCVLAACYKIDLQSLKQSLGAKKVELATEEEIAKIFDDCEPGAEPPFGNLYNITMIMDRAMEKDDHIVFQAGTHDKAIKISMADYKNLTSPKVLEFSYHSS